MGSLRGLGIGNIDVPDDNNSQEKDAAEESPQEDEEQTAAEDPQVDEDGQLVGEDAQMHIRKKNESSREVPIECGATACIFNRDGHCNADKVHIKIEGGQGGHPRGTYCQTFQTAGDDNSE